MSELRREDLVKYIEPKLIESLKKEAMSTWDNLIAEGKNEGREETLSFIVVNAFKKGKSINEIVKLVELPIERVKQIIEKFKKSLGQN